MTEMHPAGTTPLNPQATTPLPPPANKRGLKFYVQGSWEFFKKMWPAIYDLTTTETYVNASAIAFNVMLSLFSFIVLVGVFLLKVLHWPRAYEALYYLLRSLVPIESGLIFNSLDRVTQGPSSKATLLSFGLMIFSASGIFQPIEAALNRAWGFKERPVVRQYLIYLILVVICAVLILFPVAVGGVFNYLFVSFLGQQSHAADLFFQFLGPLISLPCIVALFFVVYYVVPNGSVQPAQVVFTAVATSALWLLATFGFWLALPLLDFPGSYQQLAPLMALVTWVFISSFLLILGANLSARQVLPTAWTGLLPFRRRKVASEQPAVQN